MERQRLVMPFEVISPEVMTMRLVVSGIPIGFEHFPPTKRDEPLPPTAGHIQVVAWPARHPGDGSSDQSFSRKCIIGRLAMEND
jgi:hypothetical protein